MLATPVEPTPEKTVKRSSLWDLLWYILCGFGLFTAAGTLLGLWLHDEAGSLLFSVLVYVSNVLFLGGTARVLGAGRGKFTLAEIGLVPPRWRWTWLAVAVGLVLLLLPMRGGLGLLVEYLLNGNLDSLAARSQLIQPAGTDALSFGLTLLFVGILVPISEELFFRGAIFTVLRDHWPVWAAVLVSSALFGLGHADSLGVVAASFVMGVVNAIAFEKTRSIWVPVAIHAANNSLAIILVYLAAYLAKMLPALPALP
jgi:membrane protease YdiL (CAAX protease family)